jgi:hypothetical protein
MERFNLNKKLNKVEGKEQYCVEISNRFTAMENSDTEVDVNKAWETIRENIKISAKESLGYYELKKNKPWFDEGCSELLDQRKQAKLQWLQDPREINGDNYDQFSVLCANTCQFYKFIFKILKLLKFLKVLKITTCFGQYGHPQVLKSSGGNCCFCMCPFDAHVCCTWCVVLPVVLRCMFSF